jgi:hypothetical protein
MTCGILPIFRKATAIEKSGHLSNFPTQKDESDTLQSLLAKGLAEQAEQTE